MFAGSHFVLLQKPVLVCEGPEYKVPEHTGSFSVLQKDADDATADLPYEGLVCELYRTKSHVHVALLPARDFLTRRISLSIQRQLECASL